MAKTRLQRIWGDIKTRCNNSASPKYKNYGARGIRICDEWLLFSNFQNWAINNGYSDELSIDRINVNGNYEPSNCRWATSKEQARNRTDNVLIDYENKTWILSDLSKQFNINRKTLQRRLNKGWTVKDALSIPVIHVKVQCLETKEIFSTVESAAKWAHIPASNISRVCRNKAKSAAGYHWKYI